jgi:hypothetical protein
LEGGVLLLMSTKDSLPSVINVSVEAYRMFRAMCQETITDDKKISGSKSRLSTSEKPFSTYVQAMLVAAALGLAKGERTPVGQERNWIIRGEYLRNNKNYKPFRQLLRAKFQLRTEHEVIDAFVEFAETGVRELYAEYSSTGKIDFLRLASVGTNPS